MNKNISPKSTVLALLLALLFSTAPTLLAAEEVFDSSTVTLSGTKFIFSRAPATSKAPVIITAEGRPLTAADRKFRVELQKTWIAKHVPKPYVFRSRQMVECEFKGGGVFDACDLYAFEDPKTGGKIAYYIYIGNWP